MYVSHVQMFETSEGKLDTNVWKTKKNSQVSLKTRKYDTKFTCLVGDLLFSCVITCHGPIV